MRYVEKENLAKGMVLASVLYNGYGRRLLPTNTVIGSKELGKIKSLDIPGVYIYDDEINSPFASQIISKETIRLAAASYKNQNFDACVMAANSLVDELTSSPQNIPNMIRLAEYDSYTFSHSINVAITAILIGIDLKLREPGLKELASAAFLHDIGKVKIPVAILNKKEPLTPKERELLNLHPKAGYDILKAEPEISHEVKTGVLLHHENYDGSGYPFGIYADKIHIYAQIIHVADVWDALTSKRSYKDANSPREALAYIKNNSGTLFHPACAESLARSIQPYAIGLMVRLSNNCKGVVIRNYKDSPDRPDIYLLDTGQILSMRDHPNVEIITIDGRTDSALKIANIYGL